MRSDCQGSVVPQLRLQMSQISTQASQYNLPAPPLKLISLIEEGTCKGGVTFKIQVRP
jgi:hypothetical protein